MKLLALETSTQQLSVAACAGARTAMRDGPGGAQASADLLPAVWAVLDELGLRLHELDAIAFGQGPGSFTGLRTACSVAQGLALGAGVPVLPVPTLLALAAQARWQMGHAHAASGPTGGSGAAPVIVAMLDARMGEIYAARIDFNLPGPGQVEAARQARLMKPGALQPQPGDVLAGNAWEACAGAWSPLVEGLEPTRRVSALPTARAMLQLCEPLLRAGLAVDAAHALPLYVRDNVALTSAERDRIKSATGTAS